MSAVLESHSERRKKAAHLPASSSGDFGFVDPMLHWYSTTGARVGEGIQLFIDASVVLRRPCVEPSLRSWEFAHSRALTPATVLLPVAMPVDARQSNIVDDVNWLRENLKISITEVAALFKVTRKAVYDWLEGAKPRADMADRVRILRNVLDRELREESRNFLKRVWDQPINGDASLLSIMRESEINALPASVKDGLNVLAPKLEAFGARPTLTAASHGNGKAHQDDIYRSI
jgi:DNA-binding transcriptional regulator YiaG